MAATPSYYELLGIAPDATQDEIKNAFRLESLRNHPDQGGDEVDFRLIEEAYEVLISQTRRADYDSSRLRSLGSVWGEPTPPHGVLPVHEWADDYSAAISLEPQRSLRHESHVIQHETDRGVSVHARFAGWAADRKRKKRLLFLLLLSWATFAIATRREILPSFNNASVLLLTLWVGFFWVFGSVSLRLAGWGLCLFTAAQLYLGNRTPAAAVIWLLVGFSSWLTGHWFYAWRRGRWRSRIAGTVLRRLPGRLSTDQRRNP